MEEVDSLDVYNVKDEDHFDDETDITYLLQLLKCDQVAGVDCDVQIYNSVYNSIFHVIKPVKDLGEGHHLVFNSYKKQFFIGTFSFRPKFGAATRIYISQIKRFVYMTLVDVVEFDSMLTTEAKKNMFNFINRYLSLYDNQVFNMIDLIN